MMMLLPLLYHDCIKSCTTTICHRLCNFNINGFTTVLLLALSITKCYSGIPHSSTETTSGLVKNKVFFNQTEYQQVDLLCIKNIT